jgi:CRP/FNR family cyclic AMP-dependent transcriptional regulator
LLEASIHAGVAIASCPPPRNASRMVDQELLEFLPRTSFFGGIDRSALECIVAMLVARSLPKGAVVFNEGDPGNSLFVVRRGELIVFHRSPEGGAPVKLTRLRDGDFFGEMTLLEMQPRSATVLVERDVDLLELRARDLYELYKKDIKAYVMVLQNINRELCRRLRHASYRLVEWASEAGDQTTQIGLRPVR